MFYKKKKLHRNLNQSANLAIVGTLLSEEIETIIYSNSQPAGASLICDFKPAARTPVRVARGRIA
jgi:hypothetical protein